MTDVIIEGPKSAVDSLHRELRELNLTDIAIGDVITRASSPADRRPLGMDLLTYFGVVFAAHLAAAMTHDAIKEYLAPLVAKYAGRVRVLVGKDTKGSR